MASYSLVGSGTQALTVGTGALRVHVTTIPAIAGNGRANPLNLYDVGLLRQGDGTDWWRAESIDAEHMLLPLLQGTTEIGYALLNGATVDVTEVIGTSPFYPPPFSGGSTVSLLHYVETADVSRSSTTASWTTGYSHSITVTDSSARILVCIGGDGLASNGAAHAEGTRILVDGATAYPIGGMYGGVGNYLAGAGLVDIGPLSAGVHTIDVQHRNDLGAESVQFRAATRGIYGEGYHIDVLQLS